MVPSVKYPFQPCIALIASSMCACSGEAATDLVASDVVFAQDFIFIFDLETSDRDGSGGADSDLGADGTTADVLGDSDGDGGGCLPVCVGRQCGSDGCGGSCGSCGGGLSCVSGLCPAFGQSCATPLILVFKGTTLSEKVGFAGSGGTQECQGLEGSVGANNNDATVRVLSSIVDRVRVEVSAEEPVTLHHVSECGTEGACLQQDDAALVVDVGPAIPVVLTVEGSGPSPAPATVTVHSCRSTCNVGSCQLDACGEPCPCSVGTLCSSGACVPISPGDSCTQSLSQGLPLVADFNLLTHTDAVSCRQGPAGRDRVYQFNPDSDTRLTLSVDSTSDVAAFLPPSCSGACGLAASPGAPIGIAAGAGEPLTVVIEGPASASGTVTFEPCDGCGAACPCFPGQVCSSGKCVAPTSGDSCSQPLLLKAGTNVHSTNALKGDQSCLDIPGGRDAVLRFTAPYAAEWGFTVKGVHPMMVYTLESCGSPQSCRDRAPSPLTLRRSLAAGEALFVIVEEPVSGLDGGFQVLVEDCMTTCSGAACGAIACGASCGCDSGQQCNDGVCTAAIVGDACGEPLLVAAAPVVTTISMGGLTSQFSCGDSDLARSDSVVAVPVNVSGVYFASALSAGVTSVHALERCDDGTLGCAPDGAAKTTFFRAKKGQLAHLVIESTTTSVQLSVVKTSGVGGGVGSPCATAADCPWADRCVAGFCTAFCDGDSSSCQGAADGPRGASFSCPTDVCVDDGDQCHLVCLPSLAGDMTAACDGDSDCFAGEACAAMLTSKTGIVTGFCAVSGALSEAGSSCSTAGECQSNVCLDGRCAALCGGPGDCPSGSCAGGVISTSLGALFHGFCVSPALVSCITNAECPGGACDVTLDANGGAIRACRPVTQGAAFGVGDPCLGDEFCTTGRCLFRDALGLATPYCSAPCAQDGDCAGGLACRTWTVWNGGTPSDASDDLGYGLCVRGVAGAVCNATGTNLCDSGLSCDPAPGGDFGTCQ